MTHEETTTTTAAADDKARYQRFDDLSRFAIAATDETFGGVADVYFDDAAWRLRYLVAETGTWLRGRRTLIAADALGRPDFASLSWPVSLEKAEVERAADVIVDPPVNQQEAGRRHAELAANFLIGPAEGGHPSMMTRADIAKMIGADVEPETKTANDPHLRSMSDMKGYGVHARDAEAIGSACDFLIDPDDWSVTHLVVDTGKWLPGKRVVVATSLIGGIAWDDRRIDVDLDKAKIETSPELESLSNIERAALEPIHLHYGLRGF